LQAVIPVKVKSEIKTLKLYLSLLRAHQWVKNTFIFLPLFFGSRLTDMLALTRTAIAFFAFCAAASAVYIYNDSMDVEDDRRHPRNRARPLASGAVDKTSAYILMSVLFAAGAATFLLLDRDAFLLLGFYILLNVLYTIRLKHIPLLDVVIISFGFVIRIFVGSTVSGVALSIWIVIMTFLLALFLALAKRRNDILIYLQTGEKMRKSVDGYNMEFLNSSMMIMASVVIVSYILYTVSPDVQAKMHTDKLYLTAFFVVLGILRYLQITIVENDSGSPTAILLQDRFLQLILLGWMALFSWILYMKPG
jgi:4-hydroxybenzoate polyprenyltransferase